MMKKVGWIRREKHAWMCTKERGKSPSGEIALPVKSPVKSSAQVAKMKHENVTGNIKLLPHQNSKTPSKVDSFYERGEKAT
jgi:hypothetical protein